jgi:methionyl-tRNA formyltransferase
MKQIIVLCGDQPNQWAFVDKLNSIFPISDLIIWKPKPKKRFSRIFQIASNPLALLNHVANYPYKHAWLVMLDSYSEINKKIFLKPSLVCESVNEKSVQEFLRDKRDVLLVVSGTNLLSRQFLVSLNKSVKVINLHTGLSPYVKGGPNCTNWCLALNRLDLIGNTVMWLDAGIDSGDIIASEQTKLFSVESLSDLHIRVMNHAHDLYVSAIKRVISGSPVNAIPQNKLGSGHLYLTKDWTLLHKVRGVYYFHKHFRVLKSQNNEIEHILGVPLEK